MKAITVCVDYADILSITLPRNRALFTDYLIVTSFSDPETVKLATQHNCQCLQTNAFYEHGAMFNKGLGMEQGFNALGREGWICVLDADTILPRDAVLSGLDPDYLYSPYRYLLEDVKSFSDSIIWDQLPLRPDYEYCGYCQIFHSQSKYLKSHPVWYGIGWSHCGGCDSEFQAKWPEERRRRPLWNVLHLGPTDKNWCGRVTGIEENDITSERRVNMHKVLTTYRRAELNVPVPEYHKIKKT